VPRLSEEETRRRAGAGFDAAMNTVIRQRFSQAPPPAEVAAIRREVQAIQARNEDADVTAVLSAYVEANPNSVLARYYRATNGASDWMMLPGNRGIGFNPSVFQATIRGALSVARQPYIDIVAQLSNPRNRSAPMDMSSIVARMPGAVPDLASQLHAQCDRGRNALPLTIAYDTPGQQIVLTTKLPPPETDYSFGKKKG